MAIRTEFSLDVELPKALKYLIDYHAQERKAMEAKGDTKDRWYARHCYFTASDIEQRIRAAAAEKIDNAEYGSYHQSGYSHRTAFKISGLNGQSLLDHCRSYLLHHPKLKQFNFGRGHISGLRFRSADMPFSDTEQRTMADKAKEKPIHFAPKRRKTVWGSDVQVEVTVWTPLCVIDRKTKRTSYSRPTRSTAKFTTDESKVTCPLCIKKLQAEGQRQMAEASLQESR